ERIRRLAVTIKHLVRNAPAFQVPKTVFFKCQLHPEFLPDLFNCQLLQTVGRKPCPLPQPVDIRKGLRFVSELESCLRGIQKNLPKPEAYPPDITALPHLS